MYSIVRLRFTHRARCCRKVHARNRKRASIRQHCFDKTRHEPLIRSIKAIEQITESRPGSSAATPALKMTLLLRSGRYSHARAQVDADEAILVLLKNELLQRIERVEPEEVDVVDEAQASA